MTASGAFLMAVDTAQQFNLGCHGADVGQRHEYIGDRPGKEDVFATAHPIEPQLLDSLGVESQFGSANFGA
jgi:hypothetical protein